MQAQVSRSASRFRARAPVGSLSGRPVRSSAKTGEMTARLERVYTQGNPREEVRHEVSFENHHVFIRKSDPDHCDTISTAISGGAQIEARVLIDGNEVASESECLGVAEGGVVGRRTQVPVTHRLPREEGKYELKIEARLAGSGKVIKDWTRTLDVREGSGGTPDRGDDGDEESGGVPWAAIGLGASALLAVVLLIL